MKRFEPNPGLKSIGFRLKPFKKVKHRNYDDPAWVALRNETVKRGGSTCQDPLHDEDFPRKGRVYVDHIHELKDGGALLDPANLMLRCPRCHGRKTMEERTKRSRETFR